MARPVSTVRARDAMGQDLHRGQRSEQAASTERTQNAARREQSDAEASVVRRPSLSPRAFERPVERLGDTVSVTPSAVAAFSAAKLTLCV